LPFPAVVLTPSEALPAIDELRLIGGDELVQEMTRTFLKFGRTQVSRLDEAAATGELEQGAVLAHTFKSSARQLGAVTLGDACSRAELAARGGDPAGFVQAANDVGRAFHEARPWLEALSKP
jgi:HPt (histidine-containing phosphotransfer) domain-containing protein